MRAPAVLALALALAVLAPGYAAAQIDGLGELQPYARARATILAAGYDPVVVRNGPRRADCATTGDRCRSFPEMYECVTTPRGIGCRFLFRSREDGHLHILAAIGRDQNWAVRAARPGKLTYYYAGSAGSDELEGVTIECPTGPPPPRAGFILPTCASAPADPSSR